MKSIEQLKKKDLNCNIFSVYDYDGLTITELLCQFFTKINECIDISNETIDLAKWLVNEGLEIEVAKKLVMWLEDGTLENIINVNLFNSLNEKINGISSQLDGYVNSNMSDSEIQEIVNTYNKIIFKCGSYNFTSTINIDNNKILYFENGCCFSSTKLLSSFFKSYQKSNIQIYGNGAIFNLNNCVDNAFNLYSSSDVRVNNILIDNITIKNRNLTSDKYLSGLTVRYCDNLIINNIKINNYGVNNNVGYEVYGLGVHYCNYVDIKNINIDNVMIGVLLQGCLNVVISCFNIKNTHDNGIYLLLENNNIIIKDGFLSQNEEGIANYASNITISNVTFKNCINKGITLRQGENCIITNCIFTSNKTHIGDDNNKSYKNILISNCQFFNSVEYSIFLRKSSSLKIDNNLFEHEGRLNELIRFADTTSNDCNDITITNNNFNLNENITYAIRFAPWNNGCKYAFIGYNRFNGCNTGVNIFKGSGANGGDNPYIFKNIFNGVTYDISLSGTVSGAKIERWL